MRIGTISIGRPRVAMLVEKNEVNVSVQRRSCIHRVIWSTVKNQMAAVSSFGPWGMGPAWLGSRLQALCYDAHGCNRPPIVHAHEDVIIDGIQRWLAQ